jgi:ATP synthase protein I
MQNKKNNNLAWRKYAEITGIIIEMILIIGGFVYGGIWLDEQKFIDFPLFTIVLSLSGVAIAMYILIKQANRD